MSRFLDWLLYRHRPVMTGIYQGRGVITPHTVHVPLIVGAKVARRLQAADRVEFVAVDQDLGPPIAKRVRVYRRPS
jgi:hypothetical protein